MAPSLEEATNGPSPVDTPIETPFVEAPVEAAPIEAHIDGPVAESNGNSAVEPAPAVVNTAGAGSRVRSAGPPIPGPLGIESASLKGKVALVTGAGTLFLSPFTSQKQY
jgi:hypothetical protein